MKRSLSLFILLLSAIYTMAQPAQMLDPGRSGISCSYTLAEEIGIRGSGFALGYSYKGMADLSAVYLMTFMDASRIGALRNSALGIFKGIEAGYWPLRSKNSSPLNFKTGIIAGAGESRYDNATFWDNGTYSYYHVSKNRLYYGGLETLLNISIKEHWIIQPMLAITYSLGKEYYSKNGYLGTYQNYDDLIINGGLTIGYKTTSGATIGIGIAKSILTFDETKPIVGGIEIALPL